MLSQIISRKVVRTAPTQKQKQKFLNKMKNITNTSIKQSKVHEVNTVVRHQLIQFQYVHKRIH